MRIWLDRKRLLIKFRAENARETRILSYLFDFLCHPAKSHRVVVHSFGYRSGKKKRFYKRVRYYAQRLELRFKPFGEYATKKFEERFVQKAPSR